VGRILLLLVLVSLANWSMNTLRDKEATARRRRLAQVGIAFALLGIISYLAGFASWLYRALNP
jgi:hypothetical protein